MFRVLKFQTLPSTNDYAKEHGMLSKHGDVIWAKKQTKGRGRFDREWRSKEDLSFSIIFHHSMYSHAILAPLAVVFALQNLHVDASIKWPNDILYKGKKCGGVLVERVYDGSMHCFDVVGIGLNFSNAYGKDLEDKAIHLPKDICIEDVLYKILMMYQMILRMDEHSIMRQYRTYNALIHTMITYQDHQANVIDVNDQGQLLIEVDGKEIVLCSEEITLDMWYEKGCVKT